MDNLNTQKTISANGVFDRHYLDSKSMYLYHFNKLPSVSYMYGINGEKAFKACEEKYRAETISIHQYRYYDKKRKRYDFDETLMILNNDVLLKFDEDYCIILYSGVANDFVDGCTRLVDQFKQRQRRKPLEINLIVEECGSMELKAMEIKRTKLDLRLFYEDDFAAVDEVIRTRLNKKDDKGIVLLHGLPGTGKTTYLRHLIGKIKKKVLFLSPAVARDLTNPGFIDLLIDNPNTVVVIEDAENIITDRKISGGSAVSNLLNISDGLLADFLNVQLICTFNSSLTMVDSALMRKGRLIAKYEFGKLSVGKAQKLSHHLGFDSIICKPMTVAEIANQHEQVFETRQVNVIGFRRETVLEN
jgi:tRNA uridine 5-carbamoylmethylation protein Kti12